MDQTLDWKRCGKSEAHFKALFVVPGIHQCLFILELLSDVPAFPAFFALSHTHTHNPVYGQCQSPAVVIISSLDTELEGQSDHIHVIFSTFFLQLSESLFLVNSCKLGMLYSSNILHPHTLSSYSINTSLSTALTAVSCYKDLLQTLTLPRLLSQ